VPRFPSVAADAGNEVLCTDDAVVGWFSARFVVPHAAAPALGAPATARSPVSTSATLATMAVMARRDDRGNLMRLPVGRLRWLCRFTFAP
jgi:hypothetical protein